MICASLVLLQIMFAVHRFRSGGDSSSAAEGGGLPWAMLTKSALRIHLSVSYGMIGILLIGSLRSPPPIRLRPWTRLRREGSKGSEGSEGSEGGGLPLCVNAYKISVTG